MGEAQSSSGDSGIELATASRISEKYAKRVIAAMVWGDVSEIGDGFDYSTADAIAESHISEIETTDDPMANGDYGVYATIDGIDQIMNAGATELFDFVLASGIWVDRNDDGSVDVQFAGFRRPDSGSLSLHEDDGLVKSRNGTKITFSLTLAADGGEDSNE